LSPSKFQSITKFKTFKNGKWLRVDVKISEDHDQLGKGERLP